MGLSRSKDLDFNRFIKEISRKMMGLSRSKDLPNKKKQKQKKNLSPLSESLKRFTISVMRLTSWRGESGARVSSRLASMLERGGGKFLWMREAVGNLVEWWI